MKWISIAIVLLFGLFGCSGAMHTKFNDSFYAERSALGASWLQTPALVVVSYPSSLTPAAELRVRSRYIDNHYPYSAGHGTWKVNDKALDDALMKTAYYAHEFYRALSQKIPKGRVVLLPKVVDVRNDQLVYLPETIKLPSVLQVDFMTYRHAHDNSGVGSVAGTQRHQIMALMEVRTNPEAAPETNGVLVANQGLPLLSGPSPSVLMALVAEKTSKGYAKDDKSLPKGVVAVPPTIYQIPSEEWKPHIEGLGSDRPVLAQRHLGALSNLVVDALLSVDEAKATAAARADYRSLYDPAAAASPDALDSLRLDTLLQFEAVEAGILAEASWAPLQLSFNGEWGASIRERLQDERSAYNKAQAVGWAMVLAQVATLGVPLTPAMSLANIQNYHAMTRSQDGVFANLEKSYSVVFEQQRSVAIAIGSDVRHLTASSTEELRQQMQALYHEYFGEATNVALAR